MRKCTGSDMSDWNHDAIHDVKCEKCGYAVEFFKDDISKTCPECKTKVINDRKDYGCLRNCSPDDDFKYNVCNKHSKRKRRFKL